MGLKNSFTPLRPLGVTGFIEQSLNKILSFIKDAVFSEEYAVSGGLLQALDPRIKLASLAIILLTAALIKSIGLLTFLYLVSLLLACASRINLLFFLKRTWFFVPIFAVFIALPAIFKVFSPGEVIFFSITRQGLFSASIFILRVLTSVTFSILLVLTTPHIRLLKALRSLGVPLIFVMVFMMCYRYLHIFIKIVQDSYLGIKSRLISSLESRRARKIIAWRIGVLWEKSLAMMEEITLAMLARGYSGEPKTNLAFKLRALDFWWVAGLLIFSIGILYLDGRLLI